MAMMTGTERHMRPRLFIVIGLVTLLGGAALSCRSGAEREVVRQSPASGAAAGIRVYLDDNGRPVVPTPGADPPPDNRAVDGDTQPQRASVPQRPPVRVEAAPGGGEMVLLGGLVEHQMRATRGSDGESNVDCTDARP